MKVILRVMIVEDEQRIRTGLKKLLEEVIGGFTVVAEAGNGKDGIEIFEMNVPDIVITDIRMPRMDGLEMIRRIRNKNKLVPIIILSGYDEFEYVRQALREEVVDYLLKPIDHAEFTRAILKAKDMVWVEVSQSQDENESPIIRNIKKIILQNMDKELQLQDIADEVNLNYNYLSSFFKEKTGMNFSDYIINERIKKACKLLRESNLKVYDIASLCGYTNTKYFMVLFKKVTGKTPTEFRSELTITK